MRKLYARIFTTLFLFIITGAAFASNSQLPTIGAAAVNNQTDLSLSFLSQVFGNVGTVLHGSSGQMLGHLFYRFNQGILVVAALWLSYTIITIALKSAQEGSFMGANRNVAVVLLKIALGFGLLLPNPATGYSIFQDVVMKVVVEGVALADMTWSYGLTYLNQGGSLWHRPITSKSANNLKIGTSQIQQVFADEVCMYASNAYNQENQSNNGVPTQQYHPVMPSSKNPTSFQFPGVGNNQSKVVSGSESGNCGSVSWANISGVMSGGKLTPQAKYAQNANSQMVNDLLPAAKKYFCGTSSLATNAAMCNAYTSADLSNDIPQAFFGAMVDYMNGIYPLAQFKAGEARKNAKDFLKCNENANCAQNEGWMMAGRYYWDLSQIQSSLAKVSSLSSYVPKASAASMGNHDNVNGAYKQAKSASDGYAKKAKTLLANYSKAQNKGDTGGGSHGLGRVNVGNWIMNLLLGPVVADMGNMYNQFKAGSFGPDPIYFLHRVGMDAIGMAGDIWIELAIGIFGISLAAMVCQSTLNADTPIKNVSDWARPMFMMIATIMLGVGVILGYYVPLYPYMLFTFGVIGWIIAVIEAMVAAPLVCLGLTHPENHDFLGQAQQALMLLLGVFIRPVLMVIGLFAAMILSYVSFRITIYTFSGFISDLFYTSAPTVGGGNNIEGAANALMGHAFMQGVYTGSVGQMVMSILVFPLVLVIFTALVYVITNQCFSLIYVLPDNILRWIGAPTTQSMGAQMAQQVQGVVSSFGQSTGKAANTGMKGYDKANKAKQRKNPPSNNIKGNLGQGNS